MTFTGIFTPWSPFSPLKQIPSSFSGDLLDAQGDFQTIPLPARSPPATMSTSTSPTAASSAEYAKMLNNASAKIIIGSVVRTGGPWWLLQSWLNLVVMKVVNRPYVTEAEFPRLEPIVEDDGEERTHRRSDFRFEDINHEKFQQSREIFTTAISPCILPVGIHQGRNIQVSYEFYHPMSLAKQFGMGQLPIGLYFADKIQCRSDISSTLMMDRLLNIPGPPLGSIENIKLARQQNLLLLAGVGHLLLPSATMPQRPQHFSEDSSENQPMPARSGEPDHRLQILQPRLRRRRLRQKAKPADDLPALDPSIEQALDEEEIEEDIDQAAAEISDTEKTPSASPKQAPPFPSAPAQLARVESGGRTPSAAGSHHVEEEEQLAAPTIPVLADLFSFDIKDYLDEIEEDTTSKATALLSDDVKKTLEDISHRLGASLDNLVTNCGSIRARFADIQASLPDELVDALTPAVYLEQHQFKLEKARQRLADLRECKDIEATIQTNRQLVHEEKAKLDQLSEGPIKSNIDRLEARKIELLAQLQECNAELDLKHRKLADLPQAIEEQKARLKSAIKNVAEMTKSLKVIPGTDAQDAQAIEEINQIRQRAISAIQRYLSQ
uniref:DUF1409 domain-containing protein n=1 Tax=Oryza sativa subsp. japonica TaxID=39947 RepID=A0A411DB79_ORYSJ|nr:DUF1409 domain-containing protein [Oryza sativa Japonica Group]